MMNRKMKKTILIGNGRMTNLLCFLIILSTGIQTTKAVSYSLSLPSTYTAMEGDLSAEFTLNHGPARPIDGATIHLHYLPGDSFLDSFRKTDSSVLLSSLSVPLGSQGGNVIFPCGTITHAGPHRAYLTILRNSSLIGGLRRITVAKSRILYVSWPQMSISVPEKLETYSLNVDIRISFTRNLCSTLLRQEEGALRSSNLVFAPRLELVECSKSLVNPYAQDCQLSNEAKIWFTRTLPPNFYQRAAMEVSINCSYWGQEGTFRTFLRTDLSHAPIIARSKPIVVERNPVYSLSSDYKSIYPCLQNDIKPIKVEKPFCASSSDRIQVYGQAYSLSGKNLIVPSQHWKYLGSQRVPEVSEESVHIPCSFFSKEFLQVCFKYVSYSIIGTSNVTESICLPTEEIDSTVEVPSWSSWSEWSSCSSLCRVHKEDSSGFRTRHRYCQFPQGRDKKHLLCQGSPVERQEGCGNTLCDASGLTEVKSPGDNKKIIYDEEESDESPCSCGCIYLVQQGSRRLVIRSRSNCFEDKNEDPPKRPLHWKIKTNLNHTLSAIASLEEFECPGAWFNFREGSSLHDDIINQMKIPKHNNSINSNTNFITIELTPSPLSRSSLLQTTSNERSCEFLLILQVFKKDNKKPSYISSIGPEPLGGLHQLIASAIHYLSVAGIIFLSIISVFLSCLICLVFQFEHRRKKYLEWRSSSSSGYGSPDDEENMELIPHSVPDTSHEELPLLYPEPKRSKKKKRKWQFLLENLRALREEEKRNRLSRRRSLQDLVLFPNEEGSPHDQSPIMAPVITPDQITKAIYHAASLEDKWKKVKLRLKPPEGTPSLQKDYQGLSEKRKSRSVSDIASLISFKIPSEDASKTDERHSIAKEECVDLSSTTSTIRPTIPSLSNKSSRTNLSRGMIHKRLRYPHRNSDLSSVSSFLSSRHSLDMEYDLYDCHLENVAAFPGSNFIAENYWVFDESALEDIQLVELFPKEEDKEVEDDARTLRREDAMIESQTSDLTSSFLSRPRSSNSIHFKGREDSMNISGYHSGGDEVDGLNGEEQQSSSNFLPPLHQKRDLMSITHIDEAAEEDGEVFFGTCV